MRIFLLVSIFVLMASQNHWAQTTVEDSPVAVLASKWSRYNRRIETPEVKPNVPAESVMTRSNRNFERNRRINDAPGAPPPNEGTIEARSAALEKVMQESRAPKSKIEDGFLYQLRIRNAGARIIKVLFWEFQFKERANPANVTSREFLCSVDIKPDKEQELSVFSTLSPSDSISAGGLSGKPETLFEERILINRAEYADGAILQRKDWNPAKIKPALDRLLETAWGQEQCKRL